MHVKSMPFAFRLGEIRLFAAHRTLGVVDVGLAEMAARSYAAAEPPPAIPPGLDGVVLHSVPVSGPLPRLSLVCGVIRYVPHRYPRHYIDMTCGFEDYAAGFSAKSRSTLRRKIRKFAELSGGALDFRTYRSPADMAVFHELARTVSQKSYQERLLDQGLPDDDGFRSEMIEAARRDEVRGYLLFLDGRPVSYLYCPIRGGAVLYSHLGYDPGHRQHSPGVVLQWLAMEALFAERRHRFFDFTEGDGDHKRFFATGRFECADVLFLRPGLANGAVVLGQAAMDRLSGAAAGLLDRLGLKAALRRAIRLGWPGRRRAARPEPAG